jgi:glucokinase
LKKIMSKIKITLGIDIGGTNTAFGFVDQNGKMIDEVSIPTKGWEVAEKLFDRIHKKISKLYKKYSDQYELIGVGVGAPNANYYKGIIVNPPNLQWGDVDVVAQLKEYFNLPVFITNDANATAIGEMLFGAAKGMKDFIVITLGTGLGGGVVINGKVVYGADGFAGELGHTCIEPNGRKCGCGNSGCLETYVSATGIKRTVFELLAKRMDESPLRKIKYADLSAKIIYDAAKQGDPIALEAFEYTGRLLGLSLANFAVFSRPEAFILFGGLAAAGDLIMKPAKKYMEEHLLITFKNKIKILLSGLADGNSAVLGAAALAWNELDGNSI